MDRITNDEVEKLERVVAQMEKSVLGGGSPDVMKYEEMNNLFHEMTATIAGHSRLKKIQQSLNNQIKRIAYRSFGDRKHLEASCKYHRKILEAIKAKDKVRAEHLTREHILKGLEVQEKMRKNVRGME
jgi:DNA-binding GntR family transcriptional regulator